MDEIWYMVLLLKLSSCFKFGTKSDDKIAYVNAMFQKYKKLNENFGMSS